MIITNTTINKLTEIIESVSSILVSSRVSSNSNNNNRYTFHTLYCFCSVIENTLKTIIQIVVYYCSVNGTHLLHTTNHIGVS